MWEGQSEVSVCLKGYVNIVAFNTSVNEHAKQESPIACV